jgi:hypothetical protein
MIASFMMNLVISLRHGGQPLLFLWYYKSKLK